MMTRLVLALTLLSITSACLAAGVYRWADAQGQVHFSDQPPLQGADKVKIDTPPAETHARSAVDRATRLRRLLEVYEQERKEREAQYAKQAQARQAAAMRARHCEESRNLLADYEAHGRIYDQLPNGGRRYLSATERDQEIAKMRTLVKRVCS